MLRRMFQSFLSAQEMLRARPLRYLFVLGHVRSGSSLLVHILNSHPEICAVGESWLLYDGEATFRKLVPFIHATLRKPFLTETYVVDKILDNELLQLEELLRLPRVSSIFLLRDPERSLLSMYAHRIRLKIISDWPDALSYYEGRLERLARDARFIDDRRRSMLVLYEELIDRPRPCLDALGAFLDLRAPLPLTYDVHSFTGVDGLGDFSEHIKAGTIEKTPPPTEVRVPEDILSRGKAAYDDCVAELSALCTTVPA
jgi:Sulfotransferase family